MKKILPIFSYIFHPIFIPLMACLFYFFIDGEWISFTSFEIILTHFQVVIITIFIPVSCFFLLRSLGKIDTIMVTNVSQRKIPLIIQVGLLLVLIHCGTTKDRIPELYYFFVGGLMSTLFVLIFIFGKVKISIHMVGMSSLLFFIIGISIHSHHNLIITIALWLIFSGFVASSRLFMKAHSFSEIILGFIAGMVAQVFFWNNWV